MTREQRDQLRTMLNSAPRRVYEPVMIVAPPAQAELMAAAANALEELLDDIDHLEDEVRDKTEELETWRRTYA